MSQQYLLAMLYVSGGIGGAIGNTISGAIWTNTFLKGLLSNLPGSALLDVLTIYSSLPAQLTYPVGSPERVAIQKTYGCGQSRMLAAGVSISGLAFIWMFLTRNHSVGKNEQTKGIVF